MEQRTQQDVSPYRVFSRAEWATLRQDTPMTLKPAEVTRLRSMHERLDMSEIEEIYLPLSRLLSLYVAGTQRLFRAQQGFLGLPIRSGALEPQQTLLRFREELLGLLQEGPLQLDLEFA